MDERAPSSGTMCAGGGPWNGIDGLAMTTAELTPAESVPKSKATRMNLSTRIQKTGTPPLLRLTVALDP